MKAVAERRERLAARYPRWAVRTISEHFALSVADFSDRPFVFGDNRIWSYGEMYEWSRQLGSGLIAHGIQPGDRVALDLANYPEFVALKLAIARAGAVCVPCNFLLRGEELGYVLAQSGAAMLITMDHFRGHDYLAELALTGMKGTVVVHETGQAPAPPTGHLRLAELAARGTADSDSELVEREAVASGLSLCDIIYTSGTTGRSKGVMLTHDMVLRAAYSSALTRAFDDGRRILFAMPMYHVFGYVECMVATTFVGGAIIPQVEFDPHAMLALGEKYAANEIVAVPVMTMKLIEAARDRGFDSAQLQTMFNSGGANPPTIWDEINETLRPRETVTAYGMTETTASTTCTLPEDPQERLLSSNGCLKIAGVAGDPNLNGWIAEYKAIDPLTGADLPSGEEGELVTRGPVVTRGYYDKPEETAAAFTADGWLHTGDLGRIGADGYLVLTGRIKETYRCNGEMVMPKEVEDLFNSDPGLEQALVVGIPDTRSGEAGCLCVVPRDGHRPDPTDLISRCAEKLARFKVPRHVLVLSAGDIPLTVTGRPQKFKLAQLARERIAKEKGAGA